MNERLGPSEGDAFGRLMRDCYSNGSPVGRFFGHSERDDGVLTRIDATRWLSALSPVDDAVIASVHMRNGGRVLDIGSGAGRHCEPISSAGANVTCLDPSRLCLDIAHQRGATATVLGTVEDALAGTLGTGFDSLLLLGNNLGLLGHQAQATARGQALLELLHPGGILFASSTIGTNLDSDFNREHRSRNLAAGRHPRDLWTRFRYGNAATNWYAYSYYTPDESVELFRRAGATTVEVLAEDGPDYSISVVK